MQERSFGKDGVGLGDHSDGGLVQEDEGSFVVGMRQRLPPRRVLLLLEAGLQEVGAPRAQQEPLDGDQDLVQRRARGVPLLAGALRRPGAEQAQTDLALGVQMRVHPIRHAADEVHERRLGRVAGWQVDVEEEQEAVVQRVGRPHDHRPQQVAAVGPAHHLDGARQLAQQLPLGAQFAEQPLLLLRVGGVDVAVGERGLRVEQREGVRQLRRAAERQGVDGRGGGVGGRGGARGGGQRGRLEGGNGGVRKAGDGGEEGGSGGGRGGER